MKSEVRKLQILGRSTKSCKYSDIVALLCKDCCDLICLFVCVCFNYLFCFCFVVVVVVVVVVVKKIVGFVCLHQPQLSPRSPSLPSSITWTMSPGLLYLEQSLLATLTSPKSVMIARPFSRKMFFVYKSCQQAIILLEILFLAQDLHAS